MTTPPIPNQSHRPGGPGRFTFEPMPADKSPTLIMEALLKYPGRIIHELQFNWRHDLSIWLLIFAVLGMALYGVVIGSFSGGAQMWVAPAKLALGTLLSVLICLPSLYIFACLSGIDARLRTVSGVLFAAVGLGALLLIGFAPVAWIFSQSTDSVAFMGALHLVLWAIGISFGLRLIEAMSRLLSGSAGAHLKLWGVIFVVVCLQMTTALRPIIAPAATFFPTEKKFFLANWFDSLNGSHPGKREEY
jgi:hypothetical protein